MRKTTTYARKHRRTGATYNAAEWLNVMQRSTGYSDESLPGSSLPGTQSAADKSLKIVRAAFDAFMHGIVEPHSEEPFDLIVYALGVSCIRAAQILGTTPAENVMLPPLVAANITMRKVMARRRKWGKWEMLPNEIEAVDWALEIYETILLASSPAQMALAVELRMKAIAGQPLETFT